MKIDVENEFDKCVRKVGGQRVAELVGSSPNFSNADYLFDEFGVVAELKILSVDQMHEPNIRDKMTEIYREALDRGESDVIVYGEAMITLDNVSPEYSRKLGEVYRIPVQGVIKKANKQIRQTKEHLNRIAHRGLLLLVNDKHRALEPPHIRWILQETLRNRHYSSINSVLYFTVNLKAKHPELDTQLFVWAELGRPGFEPCDKELLRKLRSTWIAQINDIVGEPIEQFRLRMEEIENLRHDFEPD